MVREGYKQTEIGEFPNEWHVEPFNHYIWYQEGPGLRKWQFTKKGMKVINVTNLQYSGLLNLDKTDRHISIEEFERMYRHFECDADDFVVASSGNSYCKSSVVRKCDLPLMMNTSVIRFKTKNGITKGYMQAYMKSKYFKEQIDLLITGGAQPNFGPAHLNKVLIPLPSTILEQKAIAKALSDVDELIASLEKLIAKKRDIKTGTMQQLLTGKIRLAGFGGDWKTSKIDDVVDVDPENLSSSTSPEYEFTYVSLEDVNRGVLSECSNQIYRTAPSRARRILRQGDVLVSTVRPNLKSHFLFTFTHKDWVCSTGFSVLRCKKNKAIPGFIYYQFFGGGIEKQIESLIAGSNYPAINSSDVRSLEIYIPEPDEQQAISNILRDMDFEINSLSAQLDKTKSIKQGMMQELLTGRIRLI